MKRGESCFRPDQEKKKEKESGGKEYDRVVTGNEIFFGPGKEGGGGGTVPVQRGCAEKKQGIIVLFLEKEVGQEK